MLLEYFRRQFAYDAWANREVLAAIRRVDGSDKRSLQLLAHIISAERLWLERIRQQAQSQPVWPECTLAAAEAQISETERQWSDFLAQLNPDRLAENISYKNTKGEPWSSRVEDILTHVLLHSAYHRGQIASHMRAGGFEPAYTDFIHAIRQGHI